PGPARSYTAPEPGQGRRSPRVARKPWLNSPRFDSLVEMLRARRRPLEPGSPGEMVLELPERQDRQLVAASAIALPPGFPGRQPVAASAIDSQRDSLGGRPVGRALELEQELQDPRARDRR